MSICPPPTCDTDTSDQWRCPVAAEIERARRRAEVLGITDLRKVLIYIAERLLAKATVRSSQESNLQDTYIQCAGLVERIAEAGMAAKEMPRTPWATAAGMQVPYGDQQQR